MKGFCFILASSDDRNHYLKKCVDCIKKTKYKDSDFYLYYQGVEDIPEKDFFRGIMRDDKLRGIFTPRYELMKKWSKDYDFTIIIDDDLFMYPDTSYDTAMAFVRAEKTAGAVSISMHSQKVKNSIERMPDNCEFFNIWGGMVIPQKIIQLVIEYFKDKEKDYTEDMFWLLAYVKGYDLYHDHTSHAIHIGNRKGKSGKASGFKKQRFENSPVPILEEWYDTKVIYSKMHKQRIWKIKQINDINEAGRKEREKCRNIMGFV